MILLIKNVYGVDTTYLSIGNSFYLLLNLLDEASIYPLDYYPNGTMYNKARRLSADVVEVIFKRNSVGNLYPDRLIGWLDDNMGNDFIVYIAHLYKNWVITNE